MYNPVYTIAAVENHTTPSGVGPATHGVGMVVPGPGRGSANVVNVGRESQLNLEDPDATLPMEETEPGVDGTSVWSSGRTRLTASTMAPNVGPVSSIIVTLLWNEIMGTPDTMVEIGA